MYGDDRHPAPSRYAVAGGEEVVQPLVRVLHHVGVAQHRRGEIPRGFWQRASTIRSGKEKGDGRVSGNKAQEQNTRNRGMKDISRITGNACAERFGWRCTDIDVSANAEAGMEIGRGRATETRVIRRSLGLRPRHRSLCAGERQGTPPIGRQALRHHPISSPLGCTILSPTSPRRCSLLRRS